MTTGDDRNTLYLGPPDDWHQVEITPPMLERVRERILAAGGALPIWGVMSEDTYETSFGDGFYIHLRGVALDRPDAERLAEIAAAADANYKWHIREYRVGLLDGLPALLDPWPLSEEFKINNVVEILSEIPPGGTASRVLIGSNWPGRESERHMLTLPEPGASDNGAGPPSSASAGNR
jgi:hypothetical protein